MTFEFGQTPFAEEFTSNLARRDWATSRIHAWFNDADGLPAFLVRGGPGSGKSTLLVQYLDQLETSGQHGSPRVIATVLRHPAYQQPFDAATFLASIVKGLSDFAPVISAEQSVSLPQITVTQQNIGQAEQVTGVSLNLGVSTISGLLASAEQRVRATPKNERVLIVVDALDQAEDELADEFLRTVAAMVRAADGTGVRLLCASRTRTSVWLDTSKRVDLDLVGDADDLDSELRDYLGDRFEEVNKQEHTRIVDALVAGAQGNWLWASVNADALESEIARSKSAPRQINLTEGLNGLHSDGWRRIRQRVASHTAEAQVKKILGAVACSFTGSLGFAEMRWATGLEPDVIRQLVRECEPFLVLDSEDNVRSFHPSFSRWLFQDGEVGLSEPSEHLRLARGLTRFGKAMRWKEEASKYAARWVLNHWCSVLILDPFPFRPDAAMHEEELAALIADPDWGDGSGSSLESIEQLGLVAPRLQLPGYEFPLLAGLRALETAPSIEAYVWNHIFQNLQDEQVDELYAIGEETRKWLEERLPDLSSITSRALWGGLLLKRFHVIETDIGVVVRPNASAVLSVLESSADKIGRRSSVMLELAAEVSHEDRPELIRALEAYLAEKASGWTTVALVNRILGRIYRVRSGEKLAEERAADLALALAAYTQAWQAVPPDHRDGLDFAIDVANTLRDLPERSAEQGELLITAQTEIRDRRREAADPSWPTSANLLGDAYRERAESREDRAAREQDLGLALAAYTQAWQAAPPEDRVDFAIDVANTLRDLPERSAEQRELLITAQTEIRDRRRDAGDPGWPTSANLVGDAYRERAESREDGAAREQDLALALAAYTQAWQAAPPDHEQRLTFAIDVADTLMELPGRSAEQRELLITAQTEIRDRMHGAGDPEWIRAENLLGDAYRERAESREDGAAREQDLALALAAYTQAWQTAPRYHEQRLTFAIDVANTLRDLAERSAEQWELLIIAQTEIRDRRRDAEHPSWPTSANLLGDAYRERAESREDGAARWRDLALALAAYTQAWQAAPPDDRVDFAIGVADTLLRLPGRSAEQWELLITAGTEIRDRRRDAEDPSWPQAANLLGRAYRERAESREDGAAREQDLALALAAYTEAWQAVPPDHELRLAFAIDVANRLLDLPGRSAEQRELLITAQTEIRDRRRDAEHPSWPQAANLLGRAYRERAEGRGDQAAREQDLALALAAYTQAWQAAPPDHEQRLTFAIDLANTLVIQAAVRPVGTMDGQVVVRRALELVSSAMVNRETDDLTELRRLLPVLSARLARQQ